MKSKRVKPPALKPGDTVGVVAPAAAVEREQLERGVNLLASIGFRVKVSERALAREGVLAGSDRDRAAELQAYFADPEVRAVFGARAGYGCGRLLPLLDFDAIAKSPKPLVGFSDATFLLNAVLDRCGMVTFHGPMVAIDMARGLSPRSIDHMRRMLTGEMREAEFEAREVVREAAAVEGEIVGGCLSVLVAMLGTPYAPDFDGKILFLEDTGERAYRIDRMLVQLKQSRVLDRIAGVVIGAISAVESSAEEHRLIARFVAEQMKELKVPVLLGIEAGHGTENLTIPFGVRARIDAGARRLKILEPAVSP